MFWKVRGWRFQHEFVSFYRSKKSCSVTKEGGWEHCPSPPYNTAMFVTSMPQNVQEEIILQECPGLLFASMMLVAEAQLHTSPNEAVVRFQKTLRWTGEMSWRPPAP